jgi:low affinity Fe/Cu permease
MTFRALFSRWAVGTAALAGQPGTFVCAVVLILIWAATGPLFHYSDTWQLIINTATTVVTFLMVFLLQATQNRDTAAIQVKLDELIRTQEGARNSLIAIEKANDPGPL